MTSQHRGSGLRRSDLRRPGGVGLLVQGGGFRGAFTLGALAGLQHAGLNQAFDLGIANSSGAISASYFLAGQADSEAARGFSSLLRQRAILSIARPWRIVDIDRLVDDIVFGTFLLDVKQLRASNTPLLVGVVDADVRLPTYYVAQEMNDLELRQLLKATSALPGLYNRTIELRGRRYIDGGFVDPLPINRLRDLGINRVLVISTSPLDYTFVNDSLGRRTVLKLLSLSQHRLVRSWIGTPNPLHDENLEALLAEQDRAESESDVSQRTIYAISPSKQYPDVIRSDSLLQTMFDDGRAKGEQVAKMLIDANVLKIDFNTSGP